MSPSGEFGNTSSDDLLGTPILIALDHDSGGHAVATSSGPPVGESWIILGVDCVAGGTGAGFCTGTAVLNTNFQFMGDVVSYVAAASTARASWRGAIPMVPGDTLEVTAEATSAGSAATAFAWGVSLPYVAHN